jgi:hypothetical protein
MDKTDPLGIRWLRLGLVFALLGGALGACALPKGGGTDGPPT